MSKKKYYWNGEPAEIQGVTYEVTEAKEGKLWWQNQFIGKRRQGLQITYGGDTWLIDNEHGEGFFKVTKGLGSPQCGHKSISNPINIKNINIIQVNKEIDLQALKEEQQSNREWAKSVDPELFKRSEALRKSILKKDKKG